MAEYRIENDVLTARFDTHGAELRSLVRKSDGREYMWSGDATYWGRVSPVLFPFVGKLREGKYTHLGKTYEGIPQHGYARDSEFKVISESDDEIWFEMLENAWWQEHYPFAFKLQIGYRLERNTLKVLWKVKNQEADDLHFSIGAHPAFLCPPGNRIDFHTDADTLAYGMVNGDGLFANPDQKLPLTDGKAVYTDALFANDALIVDGRDTNAISLADEAGAEYLRVTFAAPLVGVWSPTNRSAPFVCIEPWYGRCDAFDFAGELAKRAYGNTIAAGECWEAEYEIVVIE